MGRPRKEQIQLPKWPTAALPGSRKKVEIMEARAANNEALFHPDDGKITPELYEIVKHRCDIMARRHPLKCARQIMKAVVEKLSQEVEQKSPTEIFAKEFGEDWDG